MVGLGCKTEITHLFLLEELQETVECHDLWDFSLRGSNFPEVIDLLHAIHVAHPY